MVSTTLSKHNLKSTSVLQQLRQITATLQIGVSTDVRLLDEDVRDGALAGDFLKGVLDGGAVAYRQENKISLCRTSPGVFRYI